jgi:DNA-binding NarL/FixJ family response regulator
LFGAQGVTKSGVAKRLYLSGRTVEAQARRVFAKLDIPQREDGHRRMPAVLSHVSATRPRD